MASVYPSFPHHPALVPTHACLTPAAWWARRGLRGQTSAYNQMPLSIYNDGLRGQAAPRGMLGLCGAIKQP
ncbi:hypothetical protein E2C01_086680 [Portunus trituberculatus]|uniref:Uncharacterized protein n=1 Tax=Portunus trituberculatus TaxID=210409 RepID=A0A5B7J1H6_PORTR|nr:hypothetical protein [Portunus trituberculatus]